ncbi:hypothetical protein THTE_1562 [Thermogutta terrifontis]|uniref:Uncharacterized protein n=1 Tax=Thermogutta terrifontis TaxID=1331910 RepID=A0A286RDX1_9BACT|nr:hypothetical protein THTE_1562 [Thermogutta terrifontis]
MTSQYVGATLSRFFPYDQPRIKKRSGLFVTTERLTPRHSGITVLLAK